VHNFDLVHGLKTSYGLNKDLPDLPFFDICLFLFMLADFLKDVSVVSKFHNDTLQKNEQYNLYLPQTFAFFIQECFFVLYNVLMFD